MKRKRLLMNFLINVICFSVSRNYHTIKISLYTADMIEEITKRFKTFFLPRDIFFNL